MTENQIKEMFFKTYNLNDEKLKKFFTNRYFFVHQFPIYLQAFKDLELYEED